MKKHQKKVAEEYIRLLKKAHDSVKTAMEYKNIPAVLDLLQQCQEAAIKLGNLIEDSEGEGFVTVELLENYCELVYQIYVLVTQNQTLNPGKVLKNLKKPLIQIENSLNRDIKVRQEVVFLPYKASMWDSLESVWMAADRDPDCDAYVISVPYYDRKPDGSFGEMHDERNQYPDDVPITGYEEYDFEERQPDAVFIHNPYDGYNYVTSVHPFFYSSNLKQFTDLLVYIPYFSTAGGMSEGQASCPAYYYADYIVMQAEKYRKFYDPALPKEKLVALGSPKFDRVIRMCNNPPEPPEEWKAKMAGKKVYFYNTSINGLLGNTEDFLKKMEYVFRCFSGRKDACLLWRPHPLLESTLKSMRAPYLPVYETLKKYFLENDIGIYDDTPDMTKTIALCDAYIGDSRTSVTSLFGLAGKPLFILNNSIHREPKEDDWRGGVIKGPTLYGSDAWTVTQGSKLYHAANEAYHYKYCCDLSDYAGDSYYSMVIDFDGKSYVCPQNAQDIPVIENGEIVKRVRLEQWVERAGAFHGAVCCGQYLFLIPNLYPAIVRYDMLSGRVAYFKEHLEVFIAAVDGERRIGGYYVQDGCLFIASPTDNQVLIMEADSGKQEILLVGADNSCGCAAMESDGTDLWMLPFSGYTVKRWNPKTGEAQEYYVHPEGMKCIDIISGYESDKRPFSWLAFYRDQVWLSPRGANMYVRLDKNSGTATEWKAPFEEAEKREEVSRGYFPSWARSYFTRPKEGSVGRDWGLFCMETRKYYTVNLETGECTETEILFDPAEVRAQESGFQEYSQWLQYACEENAFNSLSNFLDGMITGNAFDRERQIRAFGEIAANHDGTCGEAIYRLVQSKE